MIMHKDYVKLFEEKEKLLGGVHYEWPFNFDFQSTESGATGASSLPTCGKYGKNGLCSVEYKIVAIPRRIEQTENEIMSMVDSMDPPFLKKSHSISPARMFLKLTWKKIEGVSEQQIKFVQMRSLAAMDRSLQGPFSRSLEIASRCLPELDQLVWKEHVIPFSIEFRWPRNIFEGVPFDFFLSVSSQSKPWNHKPPSVTLTSLKLQLFALDKAKAGEDYDEVRKGYSIWDRKGLSVRLGSDAVNIGQIYSFRLIGDGIVTNFWADLLERTYILRVELMVEVGGKSFRVWHCGDLMVDAQYGDIVTRKSFEALAYGTPRVDAQSKVVVAGNVLPENQKF